MNIYNPDCEILLKATLDSIAKNDDLKRANDSITAINDSLRGIILNGNNVETLVKPQECCNTAFLIIIGILIVIAAIVAYLKLHKKPLTSKSKKSKKNYWFGFKIFASLLITAASALQIKEIEANWLCTSELIALVTATTALVVGVFTVLSITVSLRKEKIWGITNDDFKKLMNSKISFLRMMIIFLVLASLNIIAMLFNFEIICIAISIISMGYAGFFCEQEISILIKKETKLWKIIKENINYGKKDRSENENDEEEEREKIIDNVLSHLLFEKNIKKIYRELCCKPTGDGYEENNANNVNLLDSLLEKQKERLLKNKDKDLELLSLEKNDTDIPITQLYESAIENINLLLKFDVFSLIKSLNDDPYSDTKPLLNNINHLDYYIVQSLFVIVNSKVNIIDNKLNNNIYKRLSDIFTNNIFRQLAYEEINDEKRNFLFKILTTMLSDLSDTTNNNKDWFLNILYEFYKYYGDYESDIFNYLNILEFFIVTSWFLYYMQKEEFSTTNVDTKEMIRNFVTKLDEENSSWGKLYQKFTKFGYSEEYSNFKIKILLDIHKIIARYNVINSEYLSEESLLNWFFEMLFSSDCIDSIDPQKIFEKCDKEESIRIANHLKHEWIDDNDQIKRKVPEKQTFFDSSRNDIEPHENFNNLIAWANRNSP
jgi:hypothetical protein